MNSSIFVCALMLATSAALGAQQANQSNPYAGVSHPPPNDTIVDMAPPAPNPAPASKPSPAKLATAQPAAAPSQTQPSSAVEQAEPKSAAINLPLGYPGAEPGDGTDDGMVLVKPAATNQPQPSSAVQQETPKPAAGNLPLGYPGAEPGDGTDDGIVLVEPGASSATAQPAQPVLNQSAYLNDPDDGIVHPESPAPGELGEGTNIRVRLLQSLSTAYSQSGEAFRTQVVSDVIQDGQVLIPAGSEIDGMVATVSSGHFAGYGSLHLRPETVILPDGSRYSLYAQVFGTPGSRTRVTGEGTIVPGSQLKKDSIEYGGAAGAGAVTGAILGGPAGALAGGVVGASAITAHLLLSHPQASLPTGTTLVFSLTQPLDLVPASHAGT